MTNQPKMLKPPKSWRIGGFRNLVDRLLRWFSLSKEEDSRTIQSGQLLLVLEAMI